MPKSFAITSDITGPIELKNGGQTTVIFTVTNTTNRPLRGIARLKALNINTKQEWLSFGEPKEKDFPPSGTQQYTVTFNPTVNSASTVNPDKQPAAGVPAGKYEFQLNVSSAVNPDEDSTDGPVTTIIVPEKVPTPTPKFPWWIIPVAAVLLVGIGLAAYFLWPQGGNNDAEPTPTPTPTATAVVEDVIGRQFPDAQTRLQSRGFVVVRENVQVPTKLANEVHEQNPVPNAQAPQGSNVTLKVVEPATVPNLQGKTFVQAFTELRSRGLDIGNISGPSETAFNTLSNINSQSPGANSVVAKGSKVNISFPCGTIGLKPCLVVVFTPGMTRAEALRDRRSLERLAPVNR